MITGINHIGMAVNSIDEALKVFRDTLGFKVVLEEGDVNNRGFKTTFVSTGNVKIELIQPTKPDNDFAKYIAARGEGFHHFAIETDNIETEMKNLKGKGTGTLGDAPRTGSGGSKVIFLDRKSTKFLMQLLQPGK
jgi:methylmalonyl-CoA/ethylmalonyl-CoA epimerase